MTTPCPEASPWWNTRCSAGLFAALTSVTPTGAPNVLADMSAASTIVNAAAVDFAMMVEAAIVA